MQGLYVSGVALGALAVAAALAALMRGPALAFVYPLERPQLWSPWCLSISRAAQRRRVGDTLPIGLPTIGFHLRLDSLSAFFGIVINGGVVAASIYGMGFDRAKD